MRIACSQSVSALALAASSAWATPSTAQDAAPAALAQPTGQEAVASTTGQQTASDSEQQASDDIVVTGVRRSLQESIDRKRDAVQFTDVVVAEDIGKLPDTNVAESLQRVSGVQVARGIGEGVDVSIRGLRQNLTLFNGRQLVDATGRGGQGIDPLGTPTYNLLSNIPAELIARLEVTKQPSADQADGALGGVINIVTRRPLDQDDLVLAGSAQLGTNDRWGKASYRGSVLVAESFADNTFGVLVNATYARRYVREDSFFSFNGYQSLTPAFNNNPAGLTADPNGDGRPGARIDDFRFQRLNDSRERLGLNGVLQWKPSDTFELVFESFYARTESDRNRTWFSVSTNASGSAYSSVSLTPNENLLSGTVASPLQSNFEQFNLVNTLWSNSLTGTWEIDRLKVFGEFAYTRGRARNVQRFARVTVGTAAATPSYPVAFDVTAGDVPSLSVPSTVNLTDPAAFVFTNLQDNPARIRLGQYEGRLDFLYTLDAGPLKSVEYGARYLETNFGQELIRSILGGFRIPTSAAPQGSLSVYELPDFLSGGNAAFPARFIAVNSSLYQGGRAGCTVLGSALPAGTNCNLTNIDPGATYQIGEKSYAGYVKVNFATQLGSVGVSGNAGLRYVRTDLTSTGNLILANGTVQPITATPSEDHWLPTAVVKLDLSDKLVARVGGARVVARPPTGAYNNGLSINGTPSGIGGNPNLRSFIVDQADASLEWYFGRGSIISAGLFYKDVKSFIFTSSSLETVPGFAAPLPVSRQRNGEGGTIKGLELLYQQPFTFLPAPFDGLGIAATYSYIDSETPVVDARTGRRVPIEGLSKNNINLVGYYEKGPIALRVAYNWRDRYFNSIGLNNGAIFFDSYADLSASARYVVNERLEIGVEASNLLDTGLRRYASYEEATNSYAAFGRTYNLNVRLLF